MAEADEPDPPPTQSWSGPDAAQMTPAPRPSESAIDRMLGADLPPRRGGWQPPSPEMLQASLPQYEIRALLGRGGMGAVYQGWQRSLDRFVAIKILPPGLDDGDGDFAARFRREAKAMARLKHPGIIPVHDAGETPEGLLYFVMDYVEGTDVQKLIVAQGRLPEERALTITTHVLDALTYAHEHGIIHRDIKPANIMIDDRGHVQVADFGLARSISGDTSLLTGSQVTMGTPDFMAPESRIATAPVDHRADLYAVGVMLYQMLTGKLPHGRFEPPSQVVPTLDKRLDRIVDRALQPERDARYSTAAELRTDLEPLLTRAMARNSRGVSPAAKSPARYIVAAVLVLALAGGAWFLMKPKAASKVAAPSAATPLEPGPVRLWDAPEKLPATAGVHWEDDAVRLDGSALSYVESGFQRDVIMRARIRMNLDAISPQFNVRSAGSKQEGAKRGYFLSASSRAGEVGFGWFHGAQREFLHTWPLPRTYGPDEWVLLELRASGDAFTVSLDGRELGTMHDSTLPEPGYPELYATNAGFFREIVCVPLDKGPSASAAVPPLEAGPVRLWDAPEKLPVIAGVRWEDNAVRLDGRALSFTELGNQRDLIVRARVRMNPDANSPQIGVRGAGSKLEGTHRGYFLSASAHAGKVEFGWFRGAQREFLHTWNFPRVYGPDEWVLLELRASGDAFTASLDGQELGTVHDSSLPDPGHPQIYATTAGFFREIVCIPLDKTPPASVATLPPEIGAMKLWDRRVAVPEKPGIRWEDEAVRIDENSLVAAELPDHRDVIFKAQVRMNPDAVSPQIAVRTKGTKQAGNSRGYVLNINIKAVAVRLVTYLGEQRTTLATWPLPRPYGPDEWVQLGLRAVGDELTASLDGQILGAVHDSSQPQPGHVMLYATAAGYFRDVLYQPLDQPTENSRGASATEGQAAAPSSATQETPFVNTLGMKFVPVPILGGPTGGQRVLFSVWDTRMQDYQIFAGEQGRKWPAPAAILSQGPTHPAVNITWEDARLFCQWLTQREQAAGKLPEGWSYRLPSDHEWSCAAGIGAREDAAKLPSEKSGKLRDAFVWGGQWPPPPTAGNYWSEELRPALAAGHAAWVNGELTGRQDGYAFTAPVGSYAANQFGLYDMGGNVWQWCQDWLDATLKDRVLRGAGWGDYDPYYIGSSIRGHEPPVHFGLTDGFRCVLAAPAAPAPVPAGGWQPFLTDAQWKSTTAANHEFKDGLLRVYASANKAQPQADAAIRARLRITADTSYPCVGLRRVQSKGAYKLILLPGNRMLRLSLYKSSQEDMALSTYKFPRPLEVGETLSLELRIQGSHLVALANDMPVMEADDDRLTEAGEWTISANNGWYESVEVQTLPPPPAGAKTP